MGEILARAEGTGRAQLDPERWCCEAGPPKPPQLLGHEELRGMCGLSQSPGREGARCPRGSSGRMAAALPASTPPSQASVPHPHRARCMRGSSGAGPSWQPLTCWVGLGHGTLWPELGRDLFWCHLQTCRQEAVPGPTVWQPASLLRPRARQDLEAGRSASRWLSMVDVTCPPASPPTSWSPTLQALTGQPGHHPCPGSLPSHLHPLHTGG